MGYIDVQNEFHVEKNMRNAWLMSLIAVVFVCYSSKRVLAQETALGIGASFAAGNKNIDMFILSPTSGWNSLTIPISYLPMRRELI